MGDVYGERVRPRRRWGRRLLITFIVLVLLLLAIAAVADRVAASYAERTISDRVTQQVENQKATSEKPDVKIEGIPFLTQVARGEYHEIKIGLANFAGPAGDGRTIKMKSLDITANDVRAPLETLRTGNGDIVAGTVTGAGLIDYAQLVELVGQPGVKLAEKDGKLTGSAPVQVLGQTVTVSGTADLAVQADNVVQVHFADVTAAGLPDNAIVRGLINTYVQKLAFNLTVPALPLNLKVKSVEPRPDGLLVTAKAANVPLNSNGL
ncbi:LmeA family phospholipid-binding protein [Actinoplanes sp. CA-030573]|uniref:LmeA family phospholipid-binding protein n=1 Tax=Actinoplanes sp. CA-030573 TaxID=3239898 RepID=UPI003D8CC972